MEELIAVNRRSNKTYGINEIYKFYKKRYTESLKNYTELRDSYKELLESLYDEIYKINNKFNIYEKYIDEAYNIEVIKDKLKETYNAKDGYILLLRGYYKKLIATKLNYVNNKNAVSKLEGSLLNSLEFKYIYKAYNFHMSNAVLMGYRRFYIGGVLGRITLETYSNKGKTRGIDWGLSNKLKKDLLAKGKLLYKETKDSDGTITNNGGEKWLITYNHKDVDAFWKWRGIKSNLIKTHVFKPTNYRPTILFDNSGKQLTTSELEEQSSISEIKGYSLGNTQKSTIITNLDPSYFERYNDEYELTDFKIDYKINF